MAKVTGRLVSAGLGVETTRGTSVAPSYWVPDTTFSFQDVNTKAPDDNAFGVLADAVDADITAQYAKGSLGGLLRDAHIGVILKSLFGGYSVANHSGETTVKDHTFSVAQNCQHPSLTIVSNDANENVRFALGMVDKFVLTYELGKYVTYQVDFQAKKSATGSDTVSYVSENKFRPQDVTLKLASSVAGLSGATASKVKKLTLTIQPTLSVEYVLGSVDVDDICNIGFKTMMDVELLYQDLTWKNYDFNNTKQAVSVDIVRSDITVGSAAHPELTFTFQPGFFEKWTKNVKTTALVDQKITFNGLYNLGAAAQLSAVLTNTVTSY